MLLVGSQHRSSEVIYNIEVLLKIQTDPELMSCVESDGNSVASSCVVFCCVWVGLVCCVVLCCFELCCNLGSFFVLGWVYFIVLSCILLWCVVFCCARLCCVLLYLLVLRLFYCVALCCNVALYCNGYTVDRSL